MNREYDQQYAYSKIRQPFKKIPCQQLLSAADTTSGWVKRKKKNEKWNQVYMALHKGCIYYYETELSRTEIEGFSLFGFKSVEVATECSDNKALWVFKLVHLYPFVFGAQYFSAASENELKFWLNGCTKEIKNANEGYTQAEEPQYDDGWYAAIDDVDIHVEPSVSNEYDVRRYSYPHAGIGYRVPTKRPLPSLPAEYVNAAGNQHDKHRSGSQYRPEVVSTCPPIPPRRTNKTPNTKDQRDCTDICGTDKPGKRSSFIENEVGNASNVAGNVFAGLYNNPSKWSSLVEKDVDIASNVTGKSKESSSLSKTEEDNASNDTEYYLECTFKPEESSYLSEKSKDCAPIGKFKVRVIFEYTAEDEDELTIIENQIINVLAVISEGWWYGESNGSTGLFPSNYVERITYDDLTGDIYSCVYKKKNAEESLSGEGYALVNEAEDSQKHTEDDEISASTVEEYIYYNSEGYASVHESDDSVDEKEEENDYSYSSVWDRSSMTDAHRQNSKQVIPAVLTRLNHESVSTYLRCLKDGDERNNGIRLVIVGRKNTGKTCLTKRLLKESVKNVQKTNGIEIHTLKCRGKVEENERIFQDGTRTP